MIKCPMCKETVLSSSWDETYRRCNDCVSNHFKGIPVLKDEPPKNETLRKVTYKHKTFTKGSVQTVTGKGLFHCWGADFEEFETDSATYTVAIVELESGEVRMIRADCITFEKEGNDGI